MWHASPSAVRAAAGLLVAAALGAAGAARAEDPPPAGGGALRVTADPPRLVLGRNASAELRVIAPAAVDELAITASVGRVDAVRRLPGGGFVARYRPPAEGVPQVAIVSAIATNGDGFEDGWTAIPLSGEGDARVPGAPGASITLRIGDRTFGPATVSADGVAVIPVVVPPGVREAHEGFRPIDLPVPEKPLLHAVQDRTSVQADREQKVRVLAYVVAPHGAARRGEAPMFEPSRGSVSVSEREPGAFQATWTLPPGPAGEERLSIRLPAARASRTTLKVDATRGPAAVVAVSFDRDALVAGGEAASVTARVLDAGGNTVPAELTLSVRGARLDAVKERRPGEWVARLSAGEALGGSEAVVTATASALGIAGSRSVRLRPADVAEVRFSPERLVVRGDGVREAVLRLTVADRFGNAVSAAPVVTAARGRVLEVAERGPGEYAVRYVGPAVDAPAEDAVVARLGPVRAQVAPFLAPQGPSLLVSARSGVATDASGRFTSPSAGVVAQRPADVAFALRHGSEVALRLEAEGLSVRGGALAALLAGAGARRNLGGRAELELAATAGAILAPGRTAPAARVALSLGLRRGWGLPFLEASLLGAAGGAPGAFAALGLSAGVRFELENAHGNDPDRR
jgi:hypothetical protein